MKDKNVIITRRIEIFVCESDPDLRKACYDKLHENAKTASDIANTAISHMYMLDNTTPYLSEEDREKLVYLGCTGKPCTKQNAPYTAISEKYKGKADMGMASCLIQEVRKAYQDDRKKGMWNRSLRSFNPSLPVPFKADRFVNMRFADYADGEGKKRSGCFFELMRIPFQMRFGADRSGNRLMVERVLSGQYKMLTSKIQWKKGKWFLLLCMRVPEEEYAPVEGKKLYASLGVKYPIVCSAHVEAFRDFDSGYKLLTIGTDEEFCYRRDEIRAGIRRRQIGARMDKGGHGRRRKCKSLDRWHDRERHYVDTKMHTYSKKLVEIAVHNKCDEIVLIGQEEKMEDAKREENKAILRNWSGGQLQQYVEYKALRYGIKVTVAEQEKADAAEEKRARKKLKRYERIMKTEEKREERADFVG